MDVPLKDHVNVENESEGYKAEKDDKKGYDKAEKDDNKGDDKAEKDNKGDVKAERDEKKSEAKGKKRKRNDDREDIYGNVGKFHHVLASCPWCGVIKGCGRIGKHMAYCPKKDLTVIPVPEADEEKSVQEEKSQKIS
ncbi:hypothetical protein TNCT_108291 [Trichonephila clavata]|uniref:Uncharacterized protein n=1 Tax=Trichonephila clavata TaxID=2740835 RepID=A0A8X6J8M2_TRICU|nr:hypothetical protein TNCT_108291 [Trichonephila clavata]